MPFSILVSMAVDSNISEAKGYGDTICFSLFQQSFVFSVSVAISAGEELVDPSTATKSCSGYSTPNTRLLCRGNVQLQFCLTVIYIPLLLGYKQFTTRFGYSLKVITCASSSKETYSLLPGHSLLK